LYLVYSNIVILLKHRSNTTLRAKVSHASDLLVATAVVVNVSDAIVIFVIVVLGQEHGAVRVAARVGEPDSSQVTAATMADSRKSKSSSLTGP
jgi:hypothetical protein